MADTLDYGKCSKKEKRRRQNVEAAKKSYETKKKERAELHEKHTELVQTQMKLLHDKSELSVKLENLEIIAKSIEHVCPEQYQQPPLLSNRRNYHGGSTRCGRDNYPAHFHKVRCEYTDIEQPLDMRKSAFSPPSPSEPEETENTDRMNDKHSPDQLNDNEEYRKDRRVGETILEDIGEDVPLTIDVPEEGIELQDNAGDASESLTNGYADKSDVTEVFCTESLHKAIPTTEVAHAKSTKECKNLSVEGDQKEPGNDRKNSLSAQKECSAGPQLHAGEEKLVDASTLELGATQEVQLVIMPKKPRKKPRRSQEFEETVGGAFVPNYKRPRPNHPIPC